MASIEEAKDILKTLGLPVSQQNELSALTLLALCGLKLNDKWSKATRQGLTVTKGIMEFVAKEHNRAYAPNTRETFRRQVLHQFIQACIADYNPFNPDIPTNSPRAHYAISEAALTAVKKYSTKSWPKASENFLSQHGSLSAVYQGTRSKHRVPVRLSGGTTLHLSPGKHNQVQAAVIEQFVPRFAQGASLLYLGDTEKKHLHIIEKALIELGIPVTEHDKLPDVILYQKKRDWIFLIEAVTSHGPMTPKRVFELKAVFSGCASGIVFVSAFPDFAEFRKYIKEIAWETEVWLVDAPDHLIHFNGDRFLGPR